MRYIIILLISFSYFSSSGQDKLILSNGNIFDCKIKEISETEVSYLKKELPEGPIYKIDKSKVLMIKYENGYSEVFHKNGISDSQNDIEGVYTDSRDGNNYNYKQIGQQIWLTENLRYQMDNSVCLGDKEKYCEKYGQYYTWEDALVACPDGWHLATDEEWIQLEMYAGMKHHVAIENGWRGTFPGQAYDLMDGGKTGLNILLSGYTTKYNMASKKEKEGLYWTSTPLTTTIKDNFVYIRQFKDRASIGRIKFENDNKLPVRCIKNDN